MRPTEIVFNFLLDLAECSHPHVWRETLYSMGVAAVNVRVTLNITTSMKVIVVVSVVKAKISRNV